MLLPTWTDGRFYCWSEHQLDICRFGHLVKYTIAGQSTERSRSLHRAEILARIALCTHNVCMNRSQVLSRLHAITGALRALGAVHLYVFGSSARDDMHAASDVDIFIDRDPLKPMGLLGLAKIEAELERALGAPVDVTTRNSLHPDIRQAVEQQAIQVF